MTPPSARSVTGDDDGALSEGMLGRIMRLLACFSEDEPALTAATLGARTGLSPSTLHRLVATLVRHGWLTRAAGHRYAIGTRLWELGELSPLSLRLRETALPHMLRLYEATGENVHLAVLDAPTPDTAVALFVGRITGQGSIATLSRMGGRLPLHTTGGGKALLAARDDEWLAAYFRRELEPETLHSIVDEQQLRADLARTRTRGYAVAREEMTLGNVSIAAALPPVEGLPPTAIGVVAHLEHADERRLGALVVATAKETARALRDT